MSNDTPEANELNNIARHDKVRLKAKTPIGEQTLLTHGDIWVVMGPPEYRFNKAGDMVGPDIFVIPENDTAQILRDTKGKITYHDEGGIFIPLPSNANLKIVEVIKNGG